MVEAEDEAELRRLLPQPTMGAAEPVLLPPQEPEVVAALGVEASAPQLQPRFARCCKKRPRKSSLQKYRPLTVVDVRHHTLALRVWLRERDSHYLQRRMARSTKSVIGTTDNVMPTYPSGLWSYATARRTAEAIP